MIAGAEHLVERLGRWRRIEADTVDWEADVLLAVDAGMSYRAVAAAAGCSLSRVQRIVARREAGPCTR